MDTEIIKMQLLAMPSFLMLGVGIYGWSAPPGGVDPVILGEPVFYWGTLIFGGAGALVSFVLGGKYFYKKAIKKQ